MKEDNGLDDMFRDGLSGPGRQAEYREADWDALEQMLDKPQKKRGIVLWLPVMGAAAALLLVFFGWLMLRPSTDDKDQPVIVQHKHSINTAPKSIADTQTNAVVASTHFGQQQATGPEPQASSSSPVRSVASQQQHTMVSMASQNNLVSSGHRHNKTQGNTNLVASSTNPTSISQNNTEEHHGQTLYAYNKTVFDEDKTNDHFNFPAIFDPSADLIKGPINDPVFDPNRVSMAFTVMASSTVNGVGSFQQSQVGADVGALFSVGWRKFTISTGAIYAKTPYQTDFSNYHVKRPFATAPESVNADCRILDIPLNVSYQLYSKYRNTFSVGAGLSSYLMLKEDYTYNYYLGTTGPDGYSTTNRNQHYFGVLNLSGTYQRRLNQKFSLALQPYFKLPLTDIGYGQVKLQSMGLAIGASYHIN